MSDKLKDSVKGFITLLPIEWTKGENNNISYPLAVVGSNDKAISPQAEDKA